MSDLQATITTLVQETIKSSSGRDVELAAETPLLDTGYLDSLTLLRLLAELQEAYGIDLDVTDVTEDAFATPAAIAALVEDRQG